jgi:hypothetical protein
VVSIKPEESEAHFDWLARFAGHDMPASSAITQQMLNWKPTGPGLIADLDGMDYTYDRLRGRLAPIKNFNWPICRLFVHVVPFIVGEYLGDFA